MLMNYEAKTREIKSFRRNQAKLRFCKIIRTKNKYYRIHEFQPKIPNKSTKLLFVREKRIKNE